MSALALVVLQLVKMVLQSKKSMKFALDLSPESLKVLAQQSPRRSALGDSTSSSSSPSASVDESPPAKLLNSPSRMSFGSLSKVGGFGSGGFGFPKPDGWKGLDTKAPDSIN